MSVASTTSLDPSNGHGAAAFARAAGPPRAPDEAEMCATPNGTGGASGTQGSTAGQASSGTPDDGKERPKQTPSELNAAADEDAFRLRSTGMTYRQIGERLGVDASMAHRRVKRQVFRQKTLLNERLEDTRDLELEKLRQMEQSLMPDAIGGDHAAIKLVLRIMEMRRRYLKDIPLAHADPVPWMDDTIGLFKEDEEVEEEEEDEDWDEDDDSYPEDGSITPEEERWLLYGGEKPGRRKESTETDKALQADLWQHVVETMKQEFAAKQVAANRPASTKASTTASTRASTKGSTKASTKGSTEESTVCSDPIQRIETGDHSKTA